MFSEKKEVAVKVWGDSACFTMPEYHPERISYAVMTPSGARGLLQAIFWKPQFQWLVKEIWVLNPIDYLGMTRNEIKGKVTPDMAATPIVVDSWGDRGRTQRYTRFLRDVAYVIKADVGVLEESGEVARKYTEQFNRRVESGACFSRPYLGCRECVAYFSEPSPDDKPLDGLSFGLGTMLFDIKHHEVWDRAATPEPLFFEAAVENGVLYVPQEPYDNLWAAG